MYVLGLMRITESKNVGVLYIVVIVLAKAEEATLLTHQRKNNHILYVHHTASSV